MTYLELYRKAEMLVESGKITLGEFEKMVEPLNEEITEWTPVSEKVPEEKGEYLTTCCYDNGKVVTSIGDFDYGAITDCTIWNGDEGEEYITLAWKPMPEAWKASDEVIEACVNTMKENQRKREVEQIKNNSESYIRAYGEEGYKRIIESIERGEDYKRIIKSIERGWEDS